MKNICILFGGQSSEHSISCLSGANIIKNIPKDKYKPVAVGITKNGDWFLYEDKLSLIPTGEWEKSDKKYPASFIMNSAYEGLTVFKNNLIENIKIDAVFPVLHGKNGEDGTIQGYLELLNIPYVGCGVLSSSVCMDKSFAKLVVSDLGIKQANYIRVNRHNVDSIDETIPLAENKLGYPMFVKPCNAGSSCGISKVRTATELKTAVFQALEHDSKVLIEEAIIGRELECAVLKTDIMYASDVGEITTESDYYSYDAKYQDSTSKTDVSPALPDGINEEIKKAAIRIFDAADCRGLSRVDFFLQDKTNEIVFNEINTLPGFTPISMYPMLMKKVGFELPKLIDLLVKTAFM